MLVLSRVQEQGLTTAGVQAYVVFLATVTEDGRTSFRYVVTSTERKDQNRI